MDILQRIRDMYPALTKQKGIADYLMENPEDVCYITLAPEPADSLFRTDIAALLRKNRLFQPSWNLRMNSGNTRSI